MSPHPVRPLFLSIDLYLLPVITSLLTPTSGPAPFHLFPRPCLMTSPPVQTPAAPPALPVSPDSSGALPPLSPWICQPSGPQFPEHSWLSRQLLPTTLQPLIRPSFLCSSCPQLRCPLIWEASSVPFLKCPLWASSVPCGCPITAPNTLGQISTAWHR